MAITRRQFLAWSSGALLGAGFALGARAVDAPRLTFAAINDLHILDEASASLLDAAVQRINATPEIAFTSVLGDLATAGKAPELEIAKHHLDKLAKPYYCVPGNHDVDPGLAEPYANYDRCFPERQWARQVNGWAFIGLDTCNGTSSDVTVPPERIAWLREQLLKIEPAMPCVLFSHHPFNPHTKAYRIKNAEEVLGLLAERNLKLVASGHYHGNQIEDAGGRLFATTACCSATRGNFDKTPAKGYRLFHLSAAGIEHEFVEVAS